jgi:hypothetical protein
MDRATLGILLAFGICVVIPVCGIVAWAVVEGRKSRMRHQERIAMIERGLVPPDGPPPPPPPGAAVETRVHTYQYQVPRRDYDVARGMGWAVGFLVAGALWMFTPFDGFFANTFGVVFLACGAAYMTRGIIGLTRGDGGMGGVQ